MPDNEPVAPSTPAPDAMVLALFRRHVPERIAALRTAREAGDNDKMMRVLHTLRPQLEAVDSDGLGALCASLRASEAVGSADWLSSLERLITGIEAVLGRS
ncbi:MAG: Hpt domain-containing protein [Flavobacteriales bacterium]|nr:Hpt domain-containing protein [Flavobacteriales bacterium]